MLKSTVATSDSSPLANCACTERQVQELHILLVRPLTPLTTTRAQDALTVQTVAIKRLSRQRCIVEGIEEMQMTLVTA